MPAEFDKLKAAVAVLQKAAADAIAEIHSLADQLAAHSTEDAVATDLAAQIKAQADALTAAVFPPSAAKG